jgi:peptidoglycan-associated lipoprotein
MKVRSLCSLAAVSLTLALTGCANRGGHGGANGAGIDGDRVSGTPLPDRQEGVSFLGQNVDRGRFEPIYFAFDSFAVSSGERHKIEQVAQFMRSGNNTLILAGFTDERGTPEYNRGLGERRALAVREAIIAAGGNGSHLQTVSFGAEMPADSGSSESAYAKNRRTEFGVVR